MHINTRTVFAQAAFVAKKGLHSHSVEEALPSFLARNPSLYASRESQERGHSLYLKARLKKILSIAIIFRLLICIKSTPVQQH